MIREYLGRAVRVWAVGAAALLVWLAAAGITGASASHQYNGKLADATERTHFWMVVDSQADDPTPSVDMKLAYDLRDVLSGKGGETVANFTGNSNAYGGIDNALGIQTFDDSCGNECGHLSSYMQASLRDIANGNLSQVTAADTVKKPHSSFDDALFAFFGWLLVGVGVISRPFWKRHRFANTVRGEYPDEYHLLDQTSEAIKELPAGDPQIDQLRSLHDNLEKELQRRLGRGTSEGRINNLKKELQTTLTAVQEGNKTLDS